MDKDFSRADHYNSDSLSPLIGEVLSIENYKERLLFTQSCQRNWDYKSQVSQEHLDLILFSASQAPTKQNIPFYQVIAIQNRDLIGKIYDQTEGESPEKDRLYKNSQVLANTLLVFSEYDFRCDVIDPRSPETANYAKEYFEDENERLFNEDTMQAIGIGAGLAAFTANFLGYRTGFCKCMNGENIRKILKMDRYPRLLLGVGVPDLSKNRRAHQESEELIKSYKKIVPTRVIL